MDLLIYKNQFAPIKKLNVFLRNHNKFFLCRRYLNSIKSENMLMIHEPRCENYDIPTIRTSSESPIHSKYHFHKNSIYFRLYAVFEADNESDNTIIGNKTNFFINKTRCLMVITKDLNQMMFYKVDIMNLLLLDIEI